MSKSRFFDFWWFFGIFRDFWTWLLDGFEILVIRNVIFGFLVFLDPEKKFYGNFDIKKWFFGDFGVFGQNGQKLKKLSEILHSAKLFFYFEFFALIFGVTRFSKTTPCFFWFFQNFRFFRKPSKTRVSFFMGGTPWLARCPENDVFVTFVKNRFSCLLFTPNFFGFFHFFGFFQFFSVNFKAWLHVLPIPVFTVFFSFDGIGFRDLLFCFVIFWGRTVKERVGFWPFFGFFHPFFGFWQLFSVGDRNHAFLVLKLFRFWTVLDGSVPEPSKNGQKWVIFGHFGGRRTPKNRFLHGFHAFFDILKTTQNGSFLAIFGDFGQFWTFWSFWFRDVRELR